MEWYVIVLIAVAIVVVSYITRCSSFFIQAAAGIISPIELMFARRFNEGVGS